MTLSTSRASIRKRPSPSSSPALMPTLSGGFLVNGRSWEPNEDETLMKMISELGHNWKRVAAELPGRTEAMCRNRYQRIMAPRKGAAPRNRCKACGELKRGHTCLARVRPGAVGAPRPAIAAPAFGHVAYDSLQLHEIERPALAEDNEDEELVKAFEEDSAARCPSPANDGPSADDAHQDDKAADAPISPTQATLPAGSKPSASNGDALLAPPLLAQPSLGLFAPLDALLIPQASKQASFFGLDLMELVGGQRPSSPPPAVQPLTHSQGSFSDACWA